MRLTLVMYGIFALRWCQGCDGRMRECHIDHWLLASQLVALLTVNRAKAGFAWLRGFLLAPMSCPGAKRQLNKGIAAIPRPTGADIT